VVQHGRLVLARGYGLADVEQQRPVVAEETLFHIGSNTKLFTWTAVMQQVEAGRLDLNTDVNAYLDFTVPATFPRPITLEHLMTHTAGFENRDFGWLAADAGSIQPLGTWLRENLPARVRPVGEQVGYSNYGTALAGYIVERISGTLFLDYLEQRLFRPLGMTSSTPRQPPEPALAARVARGYALENGQLKEQTLLPYQGTPAGTTRATAPDIARFMLAHLNDGRLGDAVILSPASVVEMRRTLFRVDPRVNGMAHGFIEMDRNGQRILGHLGSAAPLYYSVLALFPDHDIGVFVAYNADTARPLTVGNETLAAFADRVFPVERAGSEITSRPEAAAGMDEFVGQYRRNNFGGSYTTTEKLGRLLSAVTDRTIHNPGDGTLEVRSRLSGTARFVEMSPDFFQQPEGEDAVVFRRDSSGRVAWAAFSGEPIYAFERVSLTESTSFNIAWLGSASALLASAPVAALVSRIRSASGPRVPRAQRIARWVGSAVAAVELGFLVALIFVLSDPAPVMGRYERLQAVLILPLLGIVLSVLMVGFATLAWRQRWWSLPARIHYTTVALASVALIAFQANWNLIGFRF
jgi:CubicO group peptidase (beta-lactamase class C family)